MAPRVSIIINNYNYASYVGKAIDSALAQTHADFEVVAVDDGSTDGSGAILSSYGDSITSILKANAGQASAFNAGFEASRGDIVIFLDSDDLLMPEAAAVVTGCFDEDVAKVHWPLWRIDEHGVKNGCLYPDTPLIEGDYRALLLRDGPDHNVIPPKSPPTSGNAWARKYLRKLLPMPEAPYRTGADNYLLNIMPAYGRIKAVPEPLGCYRSHGCNDTKKPLARYAEEFVYRHEACRLALAEHLSELGLAVTPESWPRDTWFHRVSAAAPEFAAAVPEGAAFILVAEAEWHTAEFMAGRRRIPFTEHQGNYAGDPPNARAAAEELLRLWRSGADFIAFPWTKYWYWTVYPEFTDFLERVAVLATSTASWRIFRLPPRQVQFELEAGSRQH